MSHVAPLPTPSPEQVLCKALFRAQTELGLNQMELGRILGVDRTSVARIKRRGRLDPHSRTGELASCLIRIFRALYVLTGKDREALRHWLNDFNHHLGGRPRELIQSITGLVHVLDYLDAIRGKI